VNEDATPPSATRLREISARLEEITTALSSEDVDDERASALTREAASLSAEAVEEASRLLSEGSG